ncbi:MAG: hypothetical protein IKK21_08765 [Clostridia bacterium]|nr:hypothetical protein [Clostridia bacterium]
MNVILWIFGSLFACLHMVAAATQMKKDGNTARIRAGAMLLGAVGLIVAVAMSIAGAAADWLPALIGAVLICGAALANGIAASKVHWAHHILRAAISAALVIGFLLI